MASIVGVLKINIVLSGVVEMSRLFFNEYFERKQERLAERQDENLFTLEKTDVNNFEFISVSEHLEIIKKRDQLIEQVYPWIKDPSAIPFVRVRLQWIKQIEELKGGK